MAVYIGFAYDLCPVLVGLIVSNFETAIANGTANREHAAGILTMGKGIALSLGLSWPGILADVRQAMGSESALDLLADATRMITEGSTQDDG